MGTRMKVAAGLAAAGAAAALAVAATARGDLEPAARHVTAAPPAGAAAVDRLVLPPAAKQRTERHSVALGLPYAGSLVDGVRLPAEGPTFFTWDPVRKTSPNRPGRRYGTDRLVQTVLTVLDEFAAANPGAPRVGVGDLSRRRGGPFYPTHRSHQNGLDADIYFPRRDGTERPAANAKGIDRRLAQDLVDRFVAAGAQFVFVGPRTGLTGPRRVVQVLEHHDRHLHVRIPDDRRAHAGG